MDVEPHVNDRGPRWLLPPAGVALAFWLLVIRPLLLVAELDVETLIVNLYEQQAAPTWLVPWAGALIQWGPLPLILLSLTAAGHMVLRAFVPGLNHPAHRLSGRSRGLLSLLVLVPFFVASLPGALAVATWIAVEALSWVEWLYDLNPTMEAIYVAVPLCLLPGAWVGAVLATRASLGIRRSSPRPGVGPWVLRGMLGFLLVLSLSSAGAVAVAAAPQAARAARSHGSSAFKENCGTCHFRTASLNFVKAPNEWAQTIETMQGFDPTINSGEAADALAFLTAVRSQSDGWLFRTRCSRCHGSTHAGWASRSREDWEAMIQRIARWSPIYYDVRTRARLADWLSENRGDEEADLGLGQERWGRFMEVQRQCAVCHSISWNAETYRQGDRDLARATVARMSQKMVEPLTEQEIDQITDDWKALLEDPIEFDRLFPHDRPEPEPASTLEVEDRRPARGGNY